MLGGREKRSQRRRWGPMVCPCHLMLACLAVVARSPPFAPGGQRQPVCQADAFYGEVLVSALSVRTVETQQWQL